MKTTLLPSASVIANVTKRTGERLWQIYPCRAAWPERRRQAALHLDIDEMILAIGGARNDVASIERVQRTRSSHFASTTTRSAALTEAVEPAQ